MIGDQPHSNLKAESFCIFDVVKLFFQQFCSMKIFWGLFFLSLFSINSNLAQSCEQWREKDSLVLVEFYSKNCNDALKSQLNWDFTQPLDKIAPTVFKLDGQGCRVSSFVLDGYVLNSSFPTVLCKLSGLTQLELKGNDIYGELPYELYQLTNLETLVLFNNQLKGEISSELSKLQKLSVLNLGLNQFSSSFPKAICQLPRLKELGLVKNRFYGVLPTDIGNLINLEIFRIGNNQFSGNLPSSITNLTKLEVFSIPINQFIGAIPVELANIMNGKREFFIQNNFFESIPAFENIYEVHLEDNFFTIEDLLPTYSNKSSFGLLYFNTQKPIVYNHIVELAQGEEREFNLAFDQNIPTNQYSWFIENEGSPLSHDKDFLIKYNNKVHKGNLHVKITNPVMSGLEILVKHSVLSCKPNVAVLDTSICEGTYIKIHDKVFDERNTRDVFYFPSNDDSKCDSILIVNLGFLAITRDSFKAQICKGSFYNWNGQLYYNAGVYKQVFRNSQGCDSIVNLELSYINELKDGAQIDYSLGKYSISLYPSGGFQYSYLWSTGSTSSSVSNLTPGIYKVKITDLRSSCSNEFVYDLRSITGTEDVQNKLSLAWPNPIAVGHTLNLSSKLLELNPTHWSISNLQGKILTAQNFTEKNGIQIPQELDNGLYFINFWSYKKRLIAIPISIFQ